MRIFLGIPIEPEIRGEITKIQKQIDFEGIKLVEPENLHWTVKFFGELSNNELDEVKKKMDNINKNAFEIEIGGLGVFPSISYIKTIWIDCLKGKSEFKSLLEETNKTFSKIGKKDRKEKIPHLTIGRVKFTKNKEKLKKIIENNKNIVIGKSLVNKMHLYESILSTSGPKYRVLKEVVLNE